MKRKPPRAVERRTGKRGYSSGRYPHCEANASVPDYTDEEREFMVALDTFKRRNHRPFPTCCEVLAVFKSLGYRKVGG